MRPDRRDAKLFLAGNGSSGRIGSIVGCCSKRLGVAAVGFGPSSFVVARCRLLAVRLTVVSWRCGVAAAGSSSSSAKGQRRRKSLLG